MAIKKRKIIKDKRIPSWAVRKFITEHENDEEYKEETHDSGDSEWDRGYDACIDELKDFVEKYEH